MGRPCARVPFGGTGAAVVFLLVAVAYFPRTESDAPAGGDGDGDGAGAEKPYAPNPTPSPADATTPPQRCDLLTYGYMFGGSFNLGHSCGHFHHCIYVPAVCDTAEAQASNNGRDDKGKPLPGCVEEETCPAVFGDNLVVRQLRDPSDFGRADVVVINAVDYSMNYFPETKHANQTWAVIGAEPVYHHKPWHPSHYKENSFGLTDVSLGYSKKYFDLEGTYVPHTEVLHVLRRPVRNKVPGKLVAAFISSLVDSNNRVDYLEELMNYIPVDSYGERLRNVRIPPTEELDRNLPNAVSKDYRRTSKVNTLSEYKFGIAFENTNDHGYVSEKLFEALEAGVVPIYMGAPDVDRLWPLKDSFINVADYAGPKELAQYLLYLADHDDEYEKYFAWRDRPFPDSVIHDAKVTAFRWNACRLCSAHFTRVKTLESPGKILRTNHTLPFKIRLRMNSVTEMMNGRSLTIPCEEDFDETKDPFIAAVELCKKKATFGCRLSQHRLVAGFFSMWHDFRQRARTSKAWYELTSSLPMPHPLLRDLHVAYSRREFYRAVQLGELLIEKLLPRLSTAEQAFGTYLYAASLLHVLYLKDSQLSDHDEEYLYSFVKAEYKRTLELDPHHVDAHADLALWYHESGRQEKVQEHLRLALGVAGNEGRGSLWFHLGWSLELSGQEEEALSAYKKAKELDPYYTILLNTDSVATSAVGYNGEGVGPSDSVGDLVF